MKIPVIVINFKTYEEITSDRGLKLAKLCEEISKKSKKTIAVAPQLIDLALIAKAVKIPVFAQHVDNLPSGSYTGHVTPLAVKAAGAAGTIINHSERRLKIEDIRQIIETCRQIDLKTIVCANNPKESKILAAFKPDFVAIEPPELIGGKISVTTAKPEVVQSAVTKIKAVNPYAKVLCGAGVKNGEDVRRAIELGTDGVLLASGVVKAPNKREVLLDLVSGL